MFWRFGFNNGSAIDSLLDKEDVQLEAILDEDDLLQECKSQNTRLIGYFERVDVLQKLLGYVTGQTESEEKGRFKYPYVATEVLCSEIWSIVETCVNEHQQLLVPFWETVLDRSPDDMKTQTIMASHFAKINSVFLSKKPAEMLAFIQAQPSIVERLLQHIEVSSVVDLLVRIIQLDETPAGSGVVEWFSSENLMGRLLDLLSPDHSTDIHTIVTDLIKGIISMATPSPGAGLTEGLQNGPASNRFARELARPESISRLVSYMLYDFDTLPEDPAPTTPTTATGVEDIRSSSHDFPNRESATSSIVHSISVVVELIRKNNSDYFEPYLFHTLRNRLIQVQQQCHIQGEDTRGTLEQVMGEMVNRMGVVSLGPVLEIMCVRLPEFRRYLKEPRSLKGPISTTVGTITPLTWERYRIIELFAELLHCSNMSLLNRPVAYNHLYDSEGRLQGGLAGLEELSQVIALNNSNDDRQEDDMNEENDESEPAHEFPISRNPIQHSPSLDSDDDMSDDGDEPGSSDDDAMEEIAMYDEPQSQLELSPLHTELSLSQPSVLMSPSPIYSSPSPSSSPSSCSPIINPFSPPPDVDSSRPPPRSRHGSRRSSRRRATIDSSIDSLLPIGEQMKQRFLDVDVLGTLLDLFFEFPWNNFLHSAVYDLIHQVLTGHVHTGRNRELAIALFRDAKIMHKIVEGQRRNDEESMKTTGGRLGYMGHLTLISEDVITALEHFPPDLRLIIIQYAPEPEWDEYVTGRYNETKTRDTRLLGGGKPIVAQRNVTQWKVDEGDEGGIAATPGNGVGATTDSSEGGVRGQFRRATSLGSSRGTADFGPAPMEDDGDDDEDDSTKRAPQFARYLAQEMHSSDQFESSSDEEDEDEGWLSQSTFSLSNPPVSLRHQSTERRPLSTSGFDDAFNPGDNRAHAMAQDAFNAHDDDGFGPFSDAAAATNDVDPFNFPSSFSDEDSSFESFADFGDFHSATSEDEGLTPTESWTFANDSATSTSDDSNTSEDSFSSSPNDKRIILEKQL